jgi:uncharacterized Zn finger protein (UPF0148 family)
MTTAAQTQRTAHILKAKIGVCPHCGSGYVAWDEKDGEHFCCNCGWRRAARISNELAELILP